MLLYIFYLNYVKIFETEDFYINRNIGNTSTLKKNLSYTHIQNANNKKVNKNYYPSSYHMTGT